MQIITVVLGALALSVSALSSVQYPHASRQLPHLAPRLADQQTRTKTLIARNDNQEKNFTHNELFTLQKKFLDNFIAPNNTIQAKSINSSLLADNVQGRVDITRTFDGRELNTEYLFGLFANLATSTNDSNAFSLLGIPMSYEITHFAASQNIASASTLFQFFFQAINMTVPIVIQTWNVYNPAGEISMYDASFTGWWQWLFDFLLGTATQQLSAVEGKNVTLADTVSYIQNKLAISICSTAQQYCVGPALQQYQNTTQCYTYLTQQTRFGEAYELGRNTLLCRMVHQNMVPFRPAVHCPHIGPSGGGYCVDTPSYAATVGATYFSNYAFAYGNASLTG
ncbi:hypothetical protein HO133_004135 [Letharia lupina]|uniref:Secreted protein n=1 Tax=Letharia lupina TaxID=560253 RepID=A0A8H6F978_9LECA|nr:uncharacterized protein HO133_004135 [Letharia lupina]KAF6219666.1 hypothetical protein HO133_004135 [Letharia lupina]